MFSCVTFNTTFTYMKFGLCYCCRLFTLISYSCTNDQHLSYSFRYLYSTVSNRASSIRTIQRFVLSLFSKCTPWVKKNQNIILLICYCTVLSVGAMLKTNIFVSDCGIFNNDALLQVCHWKIFWKSASFLRRYWWEYNVSRCFAKLVFFYYRINAKSRWQLYSW